MSLIKKLAHTHPSVAWALSSELSHIIKFNSFFIAKYA